MPRPVSWLSRLHEIRRAVENSVRSHFDRRALEVLFKLQPSAASSLLDMLPQVQGPGRSLLVKREDLLRFLNEVHDAEDVTALCIRQRAEKEKVSQKKPRNLVLREVEPIDPASLAQWMSRGRLEVKFDTVEQLADVLWRIACAWMEDDAADEFCRLYEPAKPVSSERDLERTDVQALREEIEQMEAEWLRLHKTA